MRSLPIIIVTTFCCNWITRQGLFTFLNICKRSKHKRKQRYLSCSLVMLLTSHAQLFILKKISEHSTKGTYRIIWQVVVISQVVQSYCCWHCLTCSSNFQNHIVNLYWNRLKFNFAAQNVQDYKVRRESNKNFLKNGGDERNSTLGPKGKNCVTDVAYTLR